MTTKLEIRPSRMRCYECGSPELQVVCHHCGRGMCLEHSYSAVNSAGVPISAEFAGLGLEKAGPPFHCDDCTHVVKRRLTWFVVGSAVVAFVGILLMMFAGFGVGLVVLLAAAATGGACYLIDQRRLDVAIRSRPPLPVVPNVSSIQLRETLRGELLLDRDGTYRSSVAPVEGKLTVDMAVGRPDVERIDLYRKKFRLPETEPLRFRAGFAVLEGQVGLKFRGEQAHRPFLDLTYDVQNHPLFTPATTRGSGEWTLNLDYGLRMSDEVESIPIWLTPSFVREQDQRSLELELQWTDFGPEDCELEISRIEPLRIYVPISWGNLESHSEDATVGVVDDPDDPNESLRMIECTCLSVSEYQRKNGRVVFSMRFENEIKPTDMIRGEFVVSFEGALSGVTDVSVFHPLGGRRRLGEAEHTVQTVVEANFRLSLDGIRYQDLRMVPDHKEEADRNRQESVAFEKVIPDHETVIDLTNELSLQGYYVKRVIENPPRSGARGNVVNRYWDIAGRRYDGVYPVDFHLVLTGEELHEGDIRAHAGNTMVRITAQGAYTRPVDMNGDGPAGLEEKIVKVWEHVRDTTVATLERRAARAAEAPRYRSAASRHAAPAEEGPTAPPWLPGEDTAARIERLRKQLDDATEAVIRGEMTESVYQSIQSSIRRELDKLYGE